MSARICNKPVGGIGYGMLGLTWRNGGVSDETAISTLKTALTHGCNLWNGGEFYGTPERNSLHLLRKYFDRYPGDADKVVLNIKGGTTTSLAPDGRAEFLTASVRNCVEALGSRGSIDMFEMARRDKNLPLAEPIGTLARLVADGAIGAVALSEVNSNTIREAAAITRIAAVEIELSLWATEPLRNGIVRACADLDIPIIAYSPMGRGFLTGQIKSFEDLPGDDVRRRLPRFQPGNFEANMSLVDRVREIAARKGCTTGQLAINWVRCLSGRPGFPVVVPIPGASSPERVLENSKIVDLSEDDMSEIQSVLDSFGVAGDRYPPGVLADLADG